MREVRLHGCFIMNSCQGYSKNNSGGNNTSDLKIYNSVLILNRYFCIHFPTNFKTLQQSLLCLHYVRKSLKLK